MKIVIPGGSGQVGSILARSFHASGDEVVVISRKAASTRWRMVLWDGKNTGPWTDEIDGADVVINLTGRSVNCRYNAENRRQIMDSRIDSARAVGRAIAEAANPPPVWLQASTATIYAHRYDAPNDEATGILGGGEPNAPDTWRFSIEVAKAWERAANEAVTPKTRLVLMRSALTISADKGGIFDVLLGLVRRGLGGTVGDGRQYVSWVHGDDFVAAVRWLISHPGFAGPVNIASPNPLPQSEFTRILRQVWGVRIGLPATVWMAEIGAAVMKTETELILKSRYVVPARLQEAGFEFAHQTWLEAVRDLCQRWRNLASEGRDITLR